MLVFLAFVQRLPRVPRAPGQLAQSKYMSRPQRQIKYYFCRTAKLKITQVSRFIFKGANFYLAKGLGVRSKELLNVTNSNVAQVMMQRPAIKIS